MSQKLWCGLVLAFLLSAPAHAAELRLTISGVHSDGGELLIGLYDNAGGFVSAIANATKNGLMVDSGRLVGVSMRAKSDSQSTVFTQLPPGRYAVVVVHDENDNGLLDANVLGVPTEGYCFSRDAQGIFSAPSFDAAAVTVGDADVSATVSLIYPRPISDEDQSEYDGLVGSALAKPNQ